MGLNERSLQEESYFEEYVRIYEAFVDLKISKWEVTINSLEVPDYQILFPLYRVQGL